MATLTTTEWANFARITTPGVAIYKPAQKTNHFYATFSGTPAANDTLVITPVPQGYRLTALNVWIRDIPGTGGTFDVGLYPFSDRADWTVDVANPTDIDCFIDGGDATAVDITRMGVTAAVGIDGQTFDAAIGLKFISLTTITATVIDIFGTMLSQDI